MGTKLQPYAIGEVAEDSAEDSWEILAFPTELLPTYSGDLNAEENSTHSGESPFGESGSARGTKDQRISCIWLPMHDSGLITPPQVFIGQKVMIWQYENMDTYFWTKIYIGTNEQSLRKNEKRIIWLSNQKETGEIGAEDGYYVAVDTINKYVKIHTSDNDGEATTYDLTINTSAGEVSLEDGSGNSFKLESTSGKLTINTNNTVEVNTQEATVTAATCTIKSDLCKIN